MSPETPPINCDANRDIVPRPTSRSTANHPPIITPVINAANDKYMRCSNATSVMGTKLDVGARITKNHAPRNPHAGRLINAQTVRPSMPTTKIPGKTTSPIVCAAGQA